MHFSSNIDTAIGRKPTGIEALFSPLAGATEAPAKADSSLSPEVNKRQGAGGREQGGNPVLKSRGLKPCGLSERHKLFSPAPRKMRPLPLRSTARSFTWCSMSQLKEHLNKQNQSYVISSGCNPC